MTGGIAASGTASSRHDDQHERNVNTRDEIATTCIMINIPVLTNDL